MRSFFKYTPYRYIPFLVYVMSWLIRICLILLPDPIVDVHEEMSIREFEFDSNSVWTNYDSHVDWALHTY